MSLLLKDYKTEGFEYFNITFLPMIEKIKKGLEYVADFYRTASLGETIFLINAGQIPFNYDNPVNLGMNIIGSLCGVAITVKQFKLRRKLERAVSKHGYENRIFDKTISEWCNRQTARVVAKNYGCLEDYIDLCEGNRGRMSLPNFFNL